MELAFCPFPQESTLLYKLKYFPSFFFSDLAPLLRGFPPYGDGFSLPRKKGHPASMLATPSERVPQPSFRLYADASPFDERSLFPVCSEEFMADMGRFTPRRKSLAG